MIFGLVGDWFSKRPPPKNKTSWGLRRVIVDVKRPGREFCGGGYFFSFQGGWIDFFSIFLRGVTGRTSPEIGMRLQGGRIWGGRGGQGVQGVKIAEQGPTRTCWAGF